MMKISNKEDFLCISRNFYNSTLRNFLAAKNPYRNYTWMVDGFDLANLNEMLWTYEVIEWIVYLKSNLRYLLNSFSQGHDLSLSREGYEDWRQYHCILKINLR